MRSSYILPETLKHIAIIMDGNGRWATQRGRMRSAGHKEGARVFTAIVEECIAIQLPILTVYAFSKENWKRAHREVNAIFALLLRFITKDIPLALDNNLRLRFIGDINGLPERLQHAIYSAMEATQLNTGLQCNIAFNYSGREEIIHACKMMIDDNVQSNTLSIEQFKQYLYTKEIQDPDLIIRTGGEYRISNFLLFQSAYSEFYFSPLLWPDFTKEALREAIIEFAQRKRRFGA